MKNKFEISGKMISYLFLVHLVFESLVYLRLYLWNILPDLSFNRAAVCNLIISDPIRQFGFNQLRQCFAKKKQKSTHIAL